MLGLEINLQAKIKLRPHQVHLGNGPRCASEFGGGIPSSSSRAILSGCAPCIGFTLALPRARGGWQIHNNWSVAAPGRLVFSMGRRSVSDRIGLPPLKNARGIARLAYSAAPKDAKIGKECRIMLGRVPVVAPMATLQGSLETASRYVNLSPWVGFIGLDPLDCDLGSCWESHADYEWVSVEALGSFSNGWLVQEPPTQDKIGGRTIVLWG